MFKISLSLVGPGHQRSVPATWLSETGLHVPQGLRRGQSNPGVNRGGLSENLEVGLRKPPAVGKYFSSLPSQLLSFSSIFLGAFYLLFSSTLESQLDLLSDFQLLNNVAHSVDTKTWFLTSFAAETTAPFSTPISHDARSKI
jgi:hypothetical protein